LTTQKINLNDFPKFLSNLYFEIDDIIDTTGAGDTFNGAFSVAYWIHKWDLEKSVKYANAAASLKIQKLGARTGMPIKSQLKNFLLEHDPSFKF